MKPCPFCGHPPPTEPKTDCVFDMIRLNVRDMPESLSESEIDDWLTLNDYCVSERDGIVTLSHHGHTLASVSL